MDLFTGFKFDGLNLFESDLTIDLVVEGMISVLEDIIPVIVNLLDTLQNLVEHKCRGNNTTIIASIIS